MGQLIRPSTVTVVSDNEGRTHMTITLELNINLNSNGVPSSIGVVTADPKQPPDEDFSGIQVPDFAGSERIKFGKKVSQ